MKVLRHEGEWAVIAMMDRMNVAIQETTAVMRVVPEAVLKVKQDQARYLVPDEL